MKLRYFLGAFVLVLSLSVYANGQESEVSGGGGTAGAITAGVGSGNAGRVPQFASTTSVVDSKMLTSGTNSGTWVLYDPTAVTGLSAFAIREGAGQSTNYTWAVVDNSNTTFYARLTGGAGAQMQVVGGFGDTIDGLRLTGNLLHLKSGGVINWNANAGDILGTPDIGLARSAAGILKVTDGSTGSGGIGISDAATATVTDALILRHNGGTVAAGAGFGTGLLFQGESTTTDNSEIASIKAVWGDSTHATRDGNLELWGVIDGVATRAFTVTPSLGGAGVALVGNGITRIDSTQYIVLEGGADQSIYLGNTTEGFKWMLDGTDDSFRPYADNTYDIGTSAASIKDLYIDGSINWSDAALLRTAAGTLSQRSGTTAQEFDIYATYTDGSNYRELVLSTNIVAGGDAGVLLAGAGTGQNNGNLRVGTLTGSGSLYLVSGGTSRMSVDAGGISPGADNAYDIGTSALKVKDSYLGTSIQGTRTKVLTEGGATGFVDISVASGEGTGGYVEYTVETTDGTDRTIETGMLYFSGVNLDGGTVDDSDVGLVGTPVQSTSAANVFVNTFSVTSGTDKITVNCSSATTLAGTDVITIRYRVVVNRGTATVTPIP